MKNPREDLRLHDDDANPARGSKLAKRSCLRLGDSSPRRFDLNPPYLPSHNSDHIWKTLHPAWPEEVLSPRCACHHTLDLDAPMPRPGGLENGQDGSEKVRLAVSRPPRVVGLREGE